MKKKRTNPQSIIFTILMGVLSIIMFLISIRYMDAVEESISKDSFFYYFLPILYLLICMGSYYIGTIIHESGHLVMGLLTGYKFVSFRIGSVTFVKEKGKLVRKKFAIPGTGGQCILTHDPVNAPEEIKYFWYHFGGVFFNLLTAAAAGFVMIISGNAFVNLIMVTLLIVSLITAFMNILPLNIGAANDGLNILMQWKSPQTRLLMLNVLIINGMQYEGKRLNEIPENLFDGADPEGDSYPVNMALIKVQRYFYAHDFEAAEDILLKIVSNENAVGVILNEAKCELLFCEIILRRDISKINELYNKDLINYINQTGKYITSRKRLMYAYYLLIENNFNKAEKEYHKALAMRDTYPCRSEYESEMELIFLTREESSLFRKHFIVKTEKNDF